MRFIFLLCLAFLLTSNTKGQERAIRKIPDIQGYHTLICDFHLHTVFSDGLVWPTIRVDEAWMEGLDAIAITDHLEYLPHKDDIKTDHNRAWKIARDYASDKHVIVIAGTEITKGMPPGHLNALFIKDATAILNDDFKIAVKTAAGQGAFIMWNHPGWKVQQPETMKWWDEHTFLHENGWLHGIEVVNYGEFYPRAVDWAKEKNLTILGNSDHHGPFYNNFMNTADHRPSTLVFATEKSEGGIREALFNGRTAVYNGNDIIGKESMLKSLAMESIKIKLVDKLNYKYILINDTEFSFDLQLRDHIYQDWQIEMKLQPGYESVLELSQENSPENLEIVFRNFITGSSSCLVIPFKEILENR
ncbi:MAG: histidinol-phosphatase [Bacteroidales bacterium]|nr:histidinol-phosphatase [Bacteroidales bacterium]